MDSIFWRHSAYAAAALSLIFEHARIIEEPGTYHFMAMGELTEDVWDSAPLMRWVTDQQRWAVVVVGVEKWCVAVIALAVAFVLASARVRSMAALVLVVMRITWLGIHDGNCVQPSDSYCIWMLLLIWALALFEDQQSSRRAGLLRCVAFGAYVSGAGGYFASGLLKWRSESWRSGSALAWLADGPTARHVIASEKSWVRALLLHVSGPATLAGMAFEVALYPTLVLFGYLAPAVGLGSGNKLRSIALSFSLVMHSVLLGIIDVPWISLYMIANHIALAAADATLLEVGNVLQRERIPRSELFKHTSLALVVLLSPACLVLRCYGGSLSPLFGGVSFAFRKIGISAFTVTGYEQPPSLDALTGFEPYSFSAVDVTLHVAPRAAPWAYYCASGSCSGGDASLDLVDAAEHLVVEKQRRGDGAAPPVSLTAITALSPGTQHHQLVLLGMLLHEQGQHEVGGAAKHRFVCAGGDGYLLHEARILRTLFGIDDTIETVVGVSYAAYNPKAQQRKYFAHVDCRQFWFSKPRHLSEDRLTVHTGHTVVQAKLLLRSLFAQQVVNTTPAGEALAAPNHRKGDDTSVQCSAPSDVLAVRRLQGSNGDLSSNSVVLWTDLVADGTNAAWRVEVAHRKSLGMSQAELPNLSCNEWAHHGECEANPLFMRQWCAGSCSKRRLLDSTSLNGGDLSSRCGVMSPDSSEDLILLQKHNERSTRLVEGSSKLGGSPLSWLFLPVLIFSVAIPWGQHNARQQTAIPTALEAARERRALTPRKSWKVVGCVAAVVFMAFSIWFFCGGGSFDEGGGHGAMGHDRRGVVVVTGAGSGVGRDVSLVLLQRGLTVIATVRSRDSADALMRRALNAYPNTSLELLYGIGGESGNGGVAAVRVVRHSNGGALLTELLDLSAPPGCDRDRCYERWEAFADMVHSVRTATTAAPLLGVVHAAGVVPTFGSLEHLSRNDTLWPTFEVNVFAPLLLTRALRAQLIEGHGRVAFLGSMAAFWAGPSQVAYAASKAALEAASDALRRSLVPSGVAVALIEPGSIGGGESKMCSMPSVCNVPPRASTTPALLHFLFAKTPRSRYAVGPVSGPISLAFGWQIPASLAMVVVRPIPDFVLDALMRLFPHPIHS